jgi:hypothetical protein
MQHYYCHHHLLQQKLFRAKDEKSNLTTGRVPLESNTTGDTSINLHQISKLRYNNNQQYNRMKMIVRDQFHTKSTAS